MKFSAFIMAFLVLVLSVLPCADQETVIKADEEKTEIAQQQNHQEEQKHNDTCSPFCNCTCCAGFSINHSVLAVSSLILCDSKSYTSYLPENLFRVSSTVWQPPRIS